MSKFYVYTHSRETTGEVFYVGKGSKRRAWERARRPAHWKNVVRKNGLVVRIVVDGLNETCAFSIERMLIKKYGKENLVNITDGGDGPSGYVVPREMREYMRQVNLGRVVSEETRRKLSVANMGRNISEDHKRAVGRSNSTRPFSDKHRAAVIKANSFRQVTDETRKKISEYRKNKTRHTLFHADHGVVTGIISHFAEIYGLDPSNLRRVIRGQYKQCNGWRLPDA